MGFAKAISASGLTDAPKDTVLASSAKINEQGAIVGTAVANGRRFGFLLTPVAY